MSFFFIFFYFISFLYSETNTPCGQIKNITGDVRILKKDGSFELGEKKLNILCDSSVFVDQGSLELIIDDKLSLFFSDKTFFRFNFLKNEKKIDFFSLHLELYEGGVILKQKEKKKIIVYTALGQVLFEQGMTVIYHFPSKKITQVFNLEGKSFFSNRFHQAMAQTIDRCFMSDLSLDSLRLQPSHMKKIDLSSFFPLFHHFSLTNDEKIKTIKTCSLQKSVMELVDLEKNKIHLEFEIEDDKKKNSEKNNNKIFYQPSSLEEKNIFWRNKSEKKEKEKIIKDLVTKDILSPSSSFE